MSEIVIDVLRSEKQISLTGQVNRAGVCLQNGYRNQHLSSIPLKSSDFPPPRAAICGNSTIGDKILKSQFKLVDVRLKPDEFCSEPSTSNIFHWFVYSLEISSISLPMTADTNDIKLPFFQSKWRNCGCTAG